MMRFLQGMKTGDKESASIAAMEVLNLVANRVGDIFADFPREDIPFVISAMTHAIENIEKQMSEEEKKFALGIYNNSTVIPVSGASELKEKMKEAHLFENGDHHE
jgi:hypothetical protein